MTPYRQVRVLDGDSDAGSYGTFFVLGAEMPVLEQICTPHVSEVRVGRMHWDCAKQLASGDGFTSW